LCKCKWFTLTLDLHAIYMVIDTYTHNTASYSSIKRTKFITLLKIMLLHYELLHLVQHIQCRNPTLRECEDEIHIPEMRTWGSSGTPEISKFDYRGQNTSHWGNLYIIGKILKFRCRKWAFMGHLDIYSTSYSKKKGRESNWQFDSRPLKVGNQPDPGACRRITTHRWKALENSYKFALDLILIGGLSKELWSCKVQGVQTRTVSGLLLRNLGTKSHSNVGATERCREYYMGEGGGFPGVQAVVSLVSPELPMACLTLKMFLNVN